MKKTLWEIYHPYQSGQVAEGLNELMGFVVSVYEGQIAGLWESDETFRTCFPFLDEQGIAFDTGREVRDDIELGTWGTGEPNEGIYKDKTHYANRDIIRLDKDGEYYSRHIGAMTKEGLFGKSEIAGELAHRDREIDRLNFIIKSVAELISDDYEHEDILELLKEHGIITEER